MFRFTGCGFVKLYNCCLLIFYRSIDCMESGGSCDSFCFVLFCFCKWHSPDKRLWRVGTSTSCLQYYHNVVFRVSLWWPWLPFLNWLYLAREGFTGEMIHSPLLRRNIWSQLSLEISFTHCRTVTALPKLSGGRAWEEEPRTRVTHPRLL